MTETSTGKSAGTNVPVADEMVETAAAAIWNRSAREIDGCPPWGGRMPPNMRHSIRSDARAALEAAAPAIAAAALRHAIDAADEAFAQEDIAMTQWGNGYIDGQGAALDSIRSYADEMEADHG